MPWQEEVRCCIALAESSVGFREVDFLYQVLLCRNGRVDTFQHAGAVFQSHNVEYQTRYLPCADRLRLQIAASVIGVHRSSRYSAALLRDAVIITIVLIVSFIKSYHAATDTLYSLCSFRLGEPKLSVYRTACRTLLDRQPMMCVGVCFQFSAVNGEKFSERRPKW